MRLINKGGYSYEVTSHQIQRWLNTSIEDRFEWIYQTNQFLFEVMPKKNKIIWKKFRKGTL